MDYQAAKRQWAKRRARIRAMVKGGVTPTDAAKRFKISRSRVSHIMRNGK